MAAVTDEIKFDAQTNGQKGSPDGEDAVMISDDGGGNASENEAGGSEAEVKETEVDYKHQPMFVCCCGASFQFLGQITSHKKKACEWIYVCPHCDRVYKDYDKMTAHKEIHGMTVIPTPALLGKPLASEKVHGEGASADEEKRDDKDDSVSTSATDKDGSGKEQDKNGTKITTVGAVTSKKLVIPPTVKPPRPNMAPTNRPNFMPNKGMMNQPFMGNFNQGMMNPQMGMGMGMMNPQMGMGMMNPQMGMGNFNMNPMMGNCMPNQGFPNNMGMNNMMGGPMMMGMNMGMNMGMMGGNFGGNMGGYGPNMGMPHNANPGPNQWPMQQMGYNQGPMQQIGPNQGPGSKISPDGPMSHGKDGPMKDDIGRMSGRDAAKKRSPSPRRRTRSPSPASRSPRRLRDWSDYGDQSRFRDRDDSRDRFDRNYKEDRDRSLLWERPIKREEFRNSSRDSYREAFPNDDNPFPSERPAFRHISSRDDDPPGLSKLGFGLKRDNPEPHEHPSKISRSDSRY